jgi:phage baseplate assembly protein W
MSYIVPPTNTTLKATAKTTQIAAQAAQNINSDVRTNPQQILGWTGIKFPFRFSNTGRVVTSTTSNNDIAHIKEAIEQICLTRFRERFFNPTFGSNLLAALFENVTDVQQVFEADLLTNLAQQEKRVSFANLACNVNNAQNSVYVYMTYTVNQLFPGLIIQQNVTVTTNVHN